MEMPLLGSSARMAADTIWTSIGFLREGLVRVTGLLPNPFASRAAERPPRRRRRTEPQSVVASQARPARVRVVAVGSSVARALRECELPGGLVATSGVPRGAAKRRLQGLLERSDLLVVAGSLATAGDAAAVAFAAREMGIPALAIMTVPQRQRAERSREELRRLTSAANIVFPVPRSTSEGNGSAPGATLADAVQALAAAVRAPEVPLALQVDDLSIPAGPGVLGGVSCFRENAPGWPFTFKGARPPDRPFLGGVRLTESQRVWIWIEGGSDLSIERVNELADSFRCVAPPEAAIAFAAATSESLRPLQVTVFAS